MKKIILATGNQGKVRELNAMLKSHYIIVSQKDLQVEEVPETGSSFIENALIKARNASFQTNLPALADDSGLEVEALDGDPGIYSARYAGEEATDEDNISKLISNMEQHQNRSARFCCAMVFVENAEDTKPIIIEKYWNGEILREAIGNNGFGYDSIFYLPDLQCSSAQLEPEKKNLLSHRGQALNELLRHLISS
ncbi:RdgB/HAM1 family non-canonical purine NTP pyrophosphatase [Candidatus Thioglobus sp. NP1]|jgi:XTP/dITP diphosphohydrolase|uniref:RdgB/HAM1 family non-canonical purine NTP pyrophosphatase n=1 Tax=Candidatus Thioglobus sp. NP1 TaxID=2508687 RepID=UPI000DEE05CB|nr:RdgB/HAM1 family non-canonical purine NTP pyrophosphatase [Candidatus Thioglobus sp. NP1]AXE62647.1 non-canonical purine NTP pyrophosphatase, RdgB/HAM1 family [Candidatus Thioglobus sp. NP1]|tara:strand:+ start:8617 stop:9201 length:585 start_codon:yes stop_codon:yes gene_type:complete